MEGRPQHSRRPELEEKCLFGWEHKENVSFKNLSTFTKGISRDKDQRQEGERFHRKRKTEETGTRGCRHEKEAEDIHLGHGALRTVTSKAQALCPACIVFIHTQRTNSGFSISGFFFPKRHQL